MKTSSFHHNSVQFQVLDISIIKQHSKVLGLNLPLHLPGCNELSHTDSWAKLHWANNILTYIICCETFIKFNHEIYFNNRLCINFIFLYPNSIYLPIPKTRLSQLQGAQGTHCQKCSIVVILLGNSLDAYKKAIMNYIKNYHLKSLWPSDAIWHH